MEYFDGNDSDASLCTPPRSCSPHDSASADTNAALPQSEPALRLLDLTFSRPLRSRKEASWTLRTTYGVDSVTGLTWELQAAACHHVRYAQLQYCFGCSRLEKLRTECPNSTLPVDCRFQRIRAVCIGKGNEKISTLPASSQTGYSELLHPQHKLAKFPAQILGPVGGQETCVEALKVSVAVHLHPLVQREVEHAQNAGPDAYFVSLRPEERLTCDACEAVILMGSFACIGCARETCLDCPPLESKSSSETACCEQNARLGIVTVVAVLRMRSEELVVEMDALSQVLDAAAASGKTAAQHQNQAAQLLEIDSNLWMQWQAGRPIKLNISKEKFDWDRDRLKKEYGTLSCTVEAIGAEGVRKATLATCLDALVDQSGDENRLGMERMQVWDWPHTAKFSQMLPKLYTELMNALPFRALIHGIFDVSSWHAINGNKPELGPLASIASAGDDEYGSSGIYRNADDSVNMLAWTNGKGALRTIWRYEDSAIIDGYLATVGKNLHDGTSFATKEDVAALRKLGAKAWQCIQKPGDMVYIPAGCAHQVQNLGSCINFAVGFLSVTSIERALSLMNERCALKRLGKREGPQVDLLGMKRQLWWAWKGPQSEVKLQSALGRRSRALTQGAYSCMSVARGK